MESCRFQKGTLFHYLLWRLSTNFFAVFNQHPIDTLQRSESPTWPKPPEWQKSERYSRHAVSFQTSKVRFGYLFYGLIVDFDANMKNDLQWLMLPSCEWRWSVNLENRPLSYGRTDWDWGITSCSARLQEIYFKLNNQASEDVNMKLVGLWILRPICAQNTSRTLKMIGAGVESSHPPQHPVSEAILQGFCKASGSSGQEPPPQHATHKEQASCY